MINENSWHFKLAYEWNNNFQYLVKDARWRDEKELKMSLCEYNSAVISALVKVVTLTTIGLAFTVLMAFALTQVICSISWWIQFGLKSAIDNYQDGLVLLLIMGVMAGFIGSVIAYYEGQDVVRTWWYEKTHEPLPNGGAKHRFWYEVWTGWKNKVCRSVVIGL